MNVLDISGRAIHYCDQPGSAGPLVLIHSLGTDLRVWDGLCTLLAGSYRIIRYDQRGHGLSDAPPLPYDIADLVTDLEALLDALGVRHAIIIGASVGGPVAIGLAARRPDLVAALVLCCTAAKIGTRETWRERIALIEKQGIAAVNREIENGRFSAAFREKNPARFHAIRNMIERTDPAGYLGTCHALMEADLRETARTIGVPVLLLAGAEDQLTPPALVQSTQALIRHAEQRTLANLGHLPFFEDPAAVATALRDFLARCASETNPTISARPYACAPRE